MHCKGALPKRSYLKGLQFGLTISKRRPSDTDLASLYHQMLSSISNAEKESCKKPRKIFYFTNFMVRLFVVLAATKGSLKNLYVLLTNTESEVWTNPWTLISTKCFSKFSHKTVFCCPYTQHLYSNVQLEPFFSIYHPSCLHISNETR